MPQLGFEPNNPGVTIGRRYFVLQTSRLLIHSEALKLIRRCYVIPTGGVNISSYLLGFSRVLRRCDIVAVLQEKRNKH
jgi:hypothetical protein